MNFDLPLHILNSLSSGLWSFAMASKVDLCGKVCLVTGASRGIGKGIALQLAKAGAIVYITGRTLINQDNTVGSLKKTADEIESHGGKCYPLQCDHSKDEDVKRVFEHIERDQQGQLDILVNNAYSAVNDISQNIGTPFWEQPFAMWDSVNNVGLRNHYICSVYAAKFMVPRKNGLIVNLSSAGGLRYLFNVAYGVGKEACDRMASDCAYELKKHNVCYVSLWPGPVETEFIKEKINSGGNEYLLKMFPPEILETTEFAGMAICHLAADKDKMLKSGRILLTTDLASEYNFVDVNGKSPVSFRSVKYLIREWRVSCLVPQWVKVPHWMIAVFASKF